MIGHVRGRRAFESLRRSRRTRAGRLIVSHEPALVDGPPCVAFSIGRAVGSAVRRNRIRRQLREHLRLLVATRPELVAPGNYLVSVRPGPDASGVELRSWLTTALEQMQARP